MAVQPPRIIAHRGASGYLPEHTLEAKAYAYAAGADYLEQDVVLSRDRVPIVLHDVHLDAVTNAAERFPERRRADGRYYALDFSWEELRTLEVRERVNVKTGRPVYPRRYPVQPGVFRLHTLAEELRMIQGLNRSSGRRVGVYPEIKAPAWHRREGVEISPLVLAVLHEAGYRTREDDCFLQCFDADELRRIHQELGCELRLVQLVDEKSSNEAGSEGTPRPGPEALARMAQYADGIGPQIEQVVETDAAGAPRVTSLVAEAHAVGLEVHPYTLRQDDLPKFARDFSQACRVLCFEAHVDGVFTDFPDLMRQVVSGS